MPELPEVETTLRGITTHIKGKTIQKIIIRQPKLRWPIPSKLKKILPGQKLLNINRRGKYLLFNTHAGTLIIHLGMSGSLRLVNKELTPEKHDHVDIIFTSGQALRLRDPRRFGAVLWTNRDPESHSLLKSLGPEPLSENFNVEYLYKCSRKKKVSIKTFIMNSKVVVGVGNIYANEALFRAGIRPTLRAGGISKARYQGLITAIKEVLKEAIAQGGTTLRDFTNEKGNPGYFKQRLLVYGRAGEPCTLCQAAIKQSRQNQRATYYCPKCQH